MTRKQKWFFLDDLRFPPSSEQKEWVIFRDGPSMIETITADGTLPDGISFDHDLGENTMSGHDVAKAILDLVLDDLVVVPKNFEFRVHSDNPVGSFNIFNTMNDVFTYDRIRENL